MEATLTSSQNIKVLSISEVPCVYCKDPMVQRSLTSGHFSHKEKVANTSNPLRNIFYNGL